MLLRLIIILLFIPFIANSQEIVFGTYPSNAPEKIERAFKVLADHFSEKLGRNVRLVVTKDYAELAERISNGTVDIAWIGSVNYVKTKKNIPNIRYIATYMEDGDNTEEPIPFYKSFIVSLKSSGLKKLSDLKGKKFAFTDVDSTSGYAYPNMILRTNGIIPDDYFSKVFFLKKHDRIVQAILRGSVDAGGISDGTYYNAVKANGDLFYIIKRSEPIPLDAIVMSPTSPKELDKQIKQILLDIPADHKVNKAIIEHLRWPASGFSEKSDKFYDSLRKALGI